MEGMGASSMKRDVSGSFEKCNNVDEIMDIIKDNPLFESIMQVVPEDSRKQFMLMFELYMRGVDSAEYGSFCQMMDKAGAITDSMDARHGRGGSTMIKEYEPMKDASTRTLLLKIQMKGVAKPPMWREVEVPADVDFRYLHEVIQRVMGFEDCHLWQFNASAYDDRLVIGLSIDNDSDIGLDYVSDEASETPLTQFLSQKGDKLEYVYDFGDDWIFSIDVKNVIEKKSDYAVCVKYKSELNPIEDFGGIWSYIETRQDLEQWRELKKEVQKQRADLYGFDTPKNYIDFLKDNVLSIDDVNDELRMLEK